MSGKIVCRARKPKYIARKSWSTGTRHTHSKSVTVTPAADPPDPAPWHACLAPANFIARPRRGGALLGHRWHLTGDRDRRLMPNSPPARHAAPYMSQCSRQACTRAGARRHRRADTSQPSSFDVSARRRAGWPSLAASRASRAAGPRWTTTAQKPCKTCALMGAPTRTPLRRRRRCSERPRELARRLASEHTRSLQPAACSLQPAQ